ncbi:MAG: alanine--tRNA ligase [Patescibacteria group bacterium]
MDSQEIRQRFLKFFEERGHKVVPSSSLVPTDPSVLLTTAGMQQFKPYFVGQKDPIVDFGSKNTVSVQKSFRTSDIDEVGDETHLTFFEMLGNFSFGGYFKEDAIKYAYEFITKEMGLTIDYVSVFEGDSEVPADTESEQIWKSLGIAKIEKFGRKDNFWGPTGAEGPCGPTTEVYVKPSTGSTGSPQASSGQVAVEVWNIVFNEYYMKPDKTLEPLKVKGVDTGMGLDRLAVMVQGKKNVFETDLLEPILKILPESIDSHHKRIIADHLRASVFLLADGVMPSNKDRGYILRRLLRRIFTYEYIYKLSPQTGESLIIEVIKKYGDFYPELQNQKNNIIDMYFGEWQGFKSVLERGLKVLEKENNIDAKKAFNFYETYGLPYDIIKEIAGVKAENLTLEGFEDQFKKHQEVSRAGAEKKFGGHGITEGDLTAVNAEEMKIKTRLHTATHLLNAALHKVLGDEVSQRGSDITTERTRFDFVFNRKLTDEEIKKVEDLVNGAISVNYPVKIETMPLEEAKKSGALYFYKGNFPEIVKVYSIGNSSMDSTSSPQAGLEPPFSREICGGPHVASTREIGKFKITKEESSSAGIRRIRATVE